MLTGEGSVSISDDQGKLLFYSNGEAIWNSQHDTMSNGDNLLGHWSSSQSVAAVKKPLSDALYYIFTSGGMPGYNGIHYSIIDMNLNNGLGEVTNVKNKKLLTPSTEQLAIFNHANNRDYWIFTHKLNSDEIYAWLLTPIGVDTIPVISQTGRLILNSPPHYAGIGIMKISPDGMYLAASYYDFEIVQLFYLDNQTGKVTPKHLFSNLDDPYGIEFSPDGRFLYVAEFNMQRRVLQYDLNTLSIVGSEKELWRTPDYQQCIAAMQIGIDNKIYGAQTKIQDSMVIINQPNKKGLACDLNTSGLFLKSGENRRGLPTFNSAIFFKPTFEYQNTCFRDTTHFSTYAPSADSVRWDFGDPQSGALNYSSLMEADHFYSKPGTYTVTMHFYRRGEIWETVKEVEVVSAEVDLGSDTTLCNDETLGLNGSLPGANYLWQDSATSATYEVSAPGTYWLETEVKGCKSRDSIEVDYIQLSADLGNDTTLCENETLLLNANASGASYLWQDSTNGSVYLVKDPGIYSIEIAKGRCKASDSIQVQYRSLPLVDLGNDTVMCNGHTLMLNASIGNAQYLWQDGSTTASIEVRDSGSYSVMVSDGCVGYDTILVDFQHCDCDFWFPTAFSPNGDGFNDAYKALSDCAITYYSLRIFTRWGEEVFATDQITEAWDGKYNGEDMPQGVYIYLLQQRSYNYPVGEVRKGNVMLTR